VKYPAPICQGGRRRSAFKCSMRLLRKAQNGPEANRFRASVTQTRTFASKGKTSDVG